MMLTTQTRCWLRRHNVDYANRMLTTQTQCWLRRHHVDYADTMLTTQTRCWLRRHDVDYADTMLTTQTWCWLRTHRWYTFTVLHWPKRNKTWTSHFAMECRNEKNVFWETDWLCFVEAQAQCFFSHNFHIGSKICDTVPLTRWHLSWSYKVMRCLYSV